MVFSTELSQLKAYQHVPEVKKILDLGRMIREQAEVSTDSIDSLRGSLLRLLDTILELKSHRPYLPIRIYSLFFSVTPLEAQSDSQLAALTKTCTVMLRKIALKYPVNEDDPITLAPITETDLVLHCLTGRQYLLEALAQWVSTKGKFIYPYNNTTMYQADKELFKTLCREHQINYKPLPEQPRALNQALEELGLTSDDIGRLQVPELRINHVNALKALINEHNFTPANAARELQSLNYEQADAIASLYAQGLRGEHLRQLPFPEDDYLPLHTAVLQYLIDDHNYDIEKAIEMISAYPGEEVQTIYFTTPRVP